MVVELRSRQLQGSVDNVGMADIDHFGNVWEDGGLDDVPYSIS